MNDGEVMKDRSSHRLFMLIKEKKHKEGMVNTLIHVVGTPKDTKHLIFFPCFSLQNASRFTEFFL